jgi:hypothetical protein
MTELAVFRCASLIGIISFSSMKRHHGFRLCEATEKATLEISMPFIWLFTYRVSFTQKGLFRTSTMLNMSHLTAIPTVIVLRLSRV